VVIPTLDEAVRLPRLLQDLASLSLPHEIIIADGGSADGTAEVAAAGGCRVVRTAPGRGRQLRAAITHAQGEWLMVLHADTRLQPEALAEAEAAIVGADVQCGCWPLAIGAKGIWFRWAERGAALRWRVFGLAYGDQGLLVRRSLYDAAGGYPDVEIMEDVVLIRRLGRLTRIARFREPIITDPRRWTREGPVRASLRNVALLAFYFAGAAPNRLARWYAPEPRDR
jgi:rSAM/selenodomain-associated transferase 2